MRLYNTLTRSKQDFAPLDGKEVKLYGCGPTVYNYAHIGNLRTYVFEDMLVRTLRLKYKVTHVMNITDVGHLASDGDEGEDKLELGAAREGKSAWEIAKFYEKKFFEDFDSLNCVRPTITPRATEHIQEMIDLVKTLEEKGYTYTTADGIYYDTCKFKNYDCLMGADNLCGLKGGARVECSVEKHNPSDFALWKFSPSDKKRQMEWDSPWGAGFPGWHIECSAMAMKYLGPTLDIHCGGIDHVAVHHTNEVAQSEAATGKQYVRFWVHGEFLVLNSGKMSKSAGTFLTIDALKAEGYSPLDYRYLLLGAHYRTQLEFSFDALDFAKKSLKNLKDKIAAIKKAAGGKKGTLNKEWQDKFNACLEDDLNTAKALAMLWDALKEEAAPEDKTAFFEYADSLLALDLMKESVEETAVITPELRELLDRRALARKEKNFAMSDELRDKISALGYTVKDTPQGQVIEKK
ncbi:cysteinyl-tRNA synthetase [Parelusimicrobium proximum]|uniref:cysteine--tRNA ligase n=1 Tax=Parelusimicrobium proximum TaxID=3228953 RepID=UPI003D17186E